MYIIQKGGAFVLRKDRASRSLLGGVLILTAGNLLVKLIGLLFKIPLSRLLGDEGMGYFNTGYTVYSWLFLIGCTGFPIAVSMLVSEATEREGDDRAAKRVLFVSLFLLFSIGAVGCFLLRFFSRPIAVRIGNPGSAAAVSAIAPAVLFCSLSGAVRGYFQGKKRMGPTAVSQLTEALLKLILGMVFAHRAIDAGRDLSAVAAQAIRGVTVGTAAATVFLFFALFSEREKSVNINNRRERGEKRAVTRRLISIAFPITFSATVMSVTGLIDLILVMRRLVSAGYTLSEATALFGNYTTLAVPFFNLPGVLISPIATGIVPFISSDLARFDDGAANRRGATALRASIVLSLPSALAVGLFGERILSLFFLPASAAVAAPALAVLSPGIVFLALTTVSGAILQARGRAGVTVVSMLTGASVKMVAGYFLIGLPSVGVYGAAIGTVLCYGVAAVINLFALSYSHDRFVSLSAFLRPIPPALLSFAFAYSIGFLLPDKGSVFATVLILSVAGALYLPLSFLFGAVTGEDVEFFPFLQKIVPRSFAPRRTK